ncbi:MAG: DUF2075 domain-containing protein [Bacilli bacterium]|nr:DUF2075 domain-containing protein [Bacilli bacterium]
MLVYHESKARFDEDVLNGNIADAIKRALLEKGINDQNEAEYNAWNNSMQFMELALQDPLIPGDCDVTIEYQVPLTSKRVDFIISGSDEEGEDNVIIIELKQWTTAKKVNDIERHTVRTFVAQKERDVAHPSYQAYSYKVHIMNYAEAASDPHLHLLPCAFCHNFREEDRPVLEDPIYAPWIKQAPLFLKHDLQKLRSFIASKIRKKSPRGDLLYEIDNGRIRPAKALQDCLASLLKGNKDFQLMDEQITIYDKCIKAFCDSEKDEEKRVLIIRGGPGTGKSVLAVNLLYEFTHSSKLHAPGNAAYVTKNSAPRQCYLKILSKDSIRKEVQIKELFRSPFGLSNVPNGFYDCLIVDEAHRLVKRMYGDWNGENQIKECIAASKLTIFLIDESQRITTSDIGSIDSIRGWAKLLGVKEENVYFGDDLVLSSQFRCNGSDAYIAFLDNLLGIRPTANPDFDMDGFDIRVYDDPNKMRDDLREKNAVNNKARMVAGYCYDWNVKHRRGEWDVILPNGFKAKWNLEKNSSLWSILPESFEEVGCIHTAQGMEFDYVGVIIGKDLVYRNGRVETDKDAISNDDNSSGIKSSKDAKLADQLIRNTYKVLLSRGQKGCYIYAEDEALREHIKAVIEGGR